MCSKVHSSSRSVRCNQPLKCVQFFFTRGEERGKRESSKKLNEGSNLKSIERSEKSKSEKNVFNGADENVGIINIKNGEILSLFLRG
jgi:hypothetical protein